MISSTSRRFIFVAVAVLLSNHLNAALSERKRLIFASACVGFPVAILINDYYRQCHQRPVQKPLAVGLPVQSQVVSSSPVVRTVVRRNLSLREYIKTLGRSKKRIAMAVALTAIALIGVDSFVFMWREWWKDDLIDWWHRKPQPKPMSRDTATIDDSAALLPDDTMLEAAALVPAAIDPIPNLSPDGLKLIQASHRAFFVRQYAEQTIAPRLQALRAGQPIQAVDYAHAAAVKDEGIRLKAAAAEAQQRLGSLQKDISHGEELQQRDPEAVQARQRAKHLEKLRADLDRAQHHADKQTTALVAFRQGVRHRLIETLERRLEDLQTAHGNAYQALSDFADEQGHLPFKGGSRLQDIEAKNYDPRIITKYVANAF